MTIDDILNSLDQKPMSPQQQLGQDKEQPSISLAPSIQSKKRSNVDRASKIAALPNDNDDFHSNVTSKWIKKTLRQDGPYGEGLSIARQALRYHETEAELIRRYISKACNELEDELLKSSSDDEGFEPLIVKRQKRDDAEMKKD